MLFALYAAPLEDVIDKYGCKTVIFADDTQLYISCETPDSVSKIENCIKEIRTWMSANFLALNDSKTEIVCFTSKFKKSPAECDFVKVGESVIHKSSVVRNLGVLFDANASMSLQVANVCKAASYSLWRVGKIRHLLDRKMTEKLIHAFVTSRLDCCNSILTGIQSYQLRKLQAIQNSAARLVCRIRRSEHITPILKQLHWLPVAVRINFKLLCIVFKCIHWTIAPYYLKELIVVKTTGRSNLRSNSGIILVRPSTKTLKTYGDRAFAVVGPKLWNELPVQLRNKTDFTDFKKGLKTHYFTNCFL